MLFLVLTDGDDVGIVNQNIRRHEHRVCKQAVVDGNAFRRFVFEGMRLFQQRHRRERGENPREFTDFRHVGLAKENGFFRVKATREKIQRHRQRIFPPLLRVEQRRHRMIVRDEIKRLALILKRNGGLHHPKVISEVQRAAGLDA